MDKQPEATKLDLRHVLEKIKALVVNGTVSAEEYRVLLESAQENKRLETKVERLQNEINIDFLTSAATRAGMESGILRTLEANRQKVKESGNKYTYACVAIDLDKFKTINTIFAHEGGDMALKTFADILRKSLRDGAKIEIEKGQMAMDGRHGGDEFRAFIPIEISKGLNEGEINIAITTAIDRVKFRLESALKAIKFLVRDGHLTVEKIGDRVGEGELALGASFSHVCYEFDEKLDSKENLERVMQAFEVADKELEPIKKQKREEEYAEIERLKMVGNSISI